MKKTVLMLFLMLGWLTGKAENVVQVVPFETQAGITTDDMAYFSLNMSNEVEMVAFQFDILLPEGMTFDTTDGLNPFEFNEERVPYTVDRKGNKTFKYDVQHSDPFDGGWVTVMVFTLEDTQLSGLSGEILTAYYLTDAGMAAGIYPVKVKNIVMVTTDNQKIKFGECTSYVSVGTSPLKTEAQADMSWLTGHVPSFTIEAMNAEMADNTALTNIDLTGADAIGAVPTPGNKNALISVSSGTDCAATLAAAAAGNMVVEVDGVAQCSRLHLADGAHDFCVTSPFTADVAVVERVFKGGWWSTICLPFDIPAETLTEIKAAGVEIEKLIEFSPATGVLRFAPVEAMEAHTPYIVRTATDMQPFAEIRNVSVTETDAPTSVEVNGIVMEGVYATSVLNSDASKTYYAYDAADGAFVKIGSNGLAYPFRAFMTLPLASATLNSLSVETGCETTGIETLETVTPETRVSVVGADGRIVRNSVHPERATQGLPAGVYIVNGKKMVVE